MLFNIIGVFSVERMFAMIRYLQIVLHLPLLIIVMPPNLTAFMKEYIAIVKFDFIGQYWNWKEHPNLISFDFEG